MHRRVEYTRQSAYCRKYQNKSNQHLLRVLLASELWTNRTSDENQLFIYLAGF